MFHDLETLGSVHAIHNWEYADATEREAATGFAVTDLKKVALQLDDLTYWTLVDVAGGPSAWSPFDKGGTPFTADTPADELQAAERAQDAGASDAYAITLAPAIASYVTGTRYRFKANTANTGAATLNINGLGAQAIKKAAGGITTDLTTNDIRAGQWVEVVWDGTNFQMVSLLGNSATGGFSSSTPADQLEAATFAADAGASDAYAITLSPAISSYVTGTYYVFKANTANTGAATLNINGLGAVTIKKAAGGVTTDLATNDIRAGQWVLVVYDGTNFQMLSLLGNAPAASAPVTAVSTSTGNLDDVNFSNADVFFMNNATAATIRGLVAGVDGQRLRILSKGAGTVSFANENANSSAANRILTRFVTAGDIMVNSGGSAELVYDGTAARWVVTDYRSGTPTGPTNYTQLERATDQTATSGAAAYASFTAVNNGFGVWDGGNPTRVTCPTGQGGTWMFSIMFFLNQALTGQIQIGCRKNGSTFLFSHDFSMTGATASQVMTALVPNFQAGDYLEFYYYQASGSDKTFRVQTFMIQRVA